MKSCIGVKKCLAELEEKIQVQSITIDKHAQVSAYFKEKHIEFYYDVWHVLSGLRKRVRAAIKEMKDVNQKNLMKQLAKRFIHHVYESVEKAGNPELCKEYVFSFFMHIRGVHEWNARKFTDIISPGQGIKTGLKFRKESFRHVLNCFRHDLDDFQSIHDPVDPNVEAYQKILEMASQTLFLNDLERLKTGNFTSYVESFHSLCNIYRPKKKFYPVKGFTYRTMLAALAWNANKMAEIRGERTIKKVRESFSKAYGETRRKIWKGPKEENWKKEMVEESINRKRIEGPRSRRSSDVYDNFDDEMEDLLVRFDNLMDFDSSSDEEYYEEE